MEKQVSLRHVMKKHMELVLRTSNNSNGLKSIQFKVDTISVVDHSKKLGSHGSIHTNNIFLN